MVLTVVVLVSGFACERPDPVAVPDQIGGAAAACVPVDGETAGKPDGTLVFGALFPRSGPLGTQGSQLFAAAELAVDEVRGVTPPLGVTVAPLSPENQFDEGDPATDAVCDQITRILDPAAKNQPGAVDVVVGPMASASAERIYDRVGRAGGMVVASGSTSPALSVIPDSGGFFRTAPTDQMQGRLLGDLVVGEGLPGDKVAVVARNDVYGRGLQREVAGEISGFPQRTVRTYTYEPANPTRETFRPLVDQLLNDSPTAIVLVGYDEMAELLRMLAERGLKPNVDQGAVPRFYGTDGFMTGSFPTAVGRGPGAIAGLRGTVPYISSDVVNALKRRISAPDYILATQTYDAVVVTALAAAVAGSDEPQRVRNEVNAVTRAGTKCSSYRECITILRGNRKADIDYDGKSGPLDFTGEGEPCQGRFSVIRFNALGALEEYGLSEASFLCTVLRTTPPRPIS